LGWARLHTAEMMIVRSPDPYAFGLNMLVLTEHGSVFIKSEMKDALDAAGFKKTNELT
jgi:hypothetical protein